MWNEQSPKWRKAMKEYECEGEGCGCAILRGEKYLDKTVRDPPNTHHRYCYACGETVVEYESIRRGTNFPDRYQQRISSADWKKLKRQIITDRGNRCERCARKSESLALHHKHYRSLGRELPDDVELLCEHCHKAADEARTHSNRPKYHEPEEVWIVDPDGGHWGKLHESEIYLPLDDGSYVALKAKRSK